jgi:hypothetical protein
MSVVLPSFFLGDYKERATEELMNNTPQNFQTEGNNRTVMYLFTSDCYLCMKDTIMTMNFDSTDICWRIHCAKEEPLIGL